MKDYFIGKLSIINYEMAIHEGNANNRLASQAINILYQLSPNIDDVPLQYKKEFSKLIDCIEKTIQNLPAIGLTPVRMNGIRNITAAKYIKLLIEIEDFF